MDNNLIECFFNKMTLIKYYEVVVGSILYFILPKLKLKHFIFFVIVGIYVFNEVLSNYYLSFADKSKNDELNVLYDISMSLSFTLWFILLYQLKIIQKWVYLLLILFWIFIITVLFTVGIGIGPNLIFPFGSLIYIFLYFRDCFIKLRQEEFDYFFSNEFILVSSPLFMFFGISILFAFIDGKLQNIVILGQTLIDIVGTFNNLITYSLFLLYAYRERLLLRKQQLVHEH